MSAWIIQGNSEFDNEFANLPPEIQLELHPMMHEVVTNSTLEDLDFLNHIEGTDLYFFTTHDERYTIAFEIIHFNIIQFLVCF